MKFESLVLELEVGGLPAAVEEKWAKDASVVRLQKVEFLNYSRFISAVTRWVPSEGGVGGITPQIRWKFKWHQYIVFICFHKLPWRVPNFKVTASDFYSEIKTPQFTCLTSAIVL